LVIWADYLQLKAINIQLYHYQVVFNGYLDGPGVDGSINSITREHT